jgi:hypothetical protein
LVRATVKVLNAFLELDESISASTSNHICLVHPCFADFLINGCHDAQLKINITQTHESLALGCLNLLCTHLRQNICSIEDPTLANSDVANPPLLERLDVCVSDAVQYTVCYWTFHLTQVVAPHGGLIEILQEFVTKHMLHWLELLSLLGQTKHAAA